MVRTILRGWQEVPWRAVMRAFVVSAFLLIVVLLSTSICPMSTTTNNLMVEKVIPTISGMNKLVR